VGKYSVISESVIGHKKNRTRQESKVGKNLYFRFFFYAGAIAVLQKQSCETPVRGGGVGGGLRVKEA
jgi:hypothetical protein